MAALIYVIATTLINLYLSIAWSSSGKLNAFIKMIFILFTLYGVLIILGHFPPEVVANFFRGTM